MDSQQISVARRNLRLDGVQYELAALQVNGGDYQATWHCPKCQVGGASNLTYARPNAALDWAQNCAAIHELEVHAK